LAENPTDEMLRYAVIDAETAVFQNRTMLGDIARHIQRAPGAEFVIPFGRTPSAIAMQIVNYSPVGAVKAVVENIQNFDQRLFSQAIGRSVVGTATLYVGAMLFKAGLMSLDRPKTERERELWKVEGRSANSIKIGDQWRSVQVLGPAGTVLMIGGHFAKAMDDTGSPTKAMVTALAGGAKSFSEQTFLKGLNNSVQALMDPERSFETFASSLAGSAVPTIVADIARASDSTERRVSGPVERIESRIPGLRQSLEPSMTVFGQDLPRYGGNVLEVMLDPTRPAKIQQDVVVDELRRLWDGGHEASPTLLGDKKGYEVLTPEQNTELWRRAGELTYYHVWRTMQTGEYQQSDDEYRTRLINNAVDDAKVIARTEMAYNILSALPQGEQLIRKIEFREGGLVTKEISRELDKLL